VTPKGTVCKTGYTLAEVNKEGPEGESGPQGKEGPQGPAGPPGAGNTIVHTLDIADGATGTLLSIPGVLTLELECPQLIRITDTSGGYLYAQGIQGTLLPGAPVVWLSNNLRTEFNLPAAGQTDPVLIDVGNTNKVVALQASDSFGTYNGAEFLDFNCHAAAQATVTE